MGCLELQIKIYNQPVPEFTRTIFNWNGYTTPNIYAHYNDGKNAKTYLINVKNHTRTMYRLFNVKDYALYWWNSNNEMKPDIDYGYSGRLDKYKEPRDRFYHIDLLGSTTLYFSNDKFKIFSFALESRNHALGAETTVKSFQSQNLRNWGYDKKHYSHSRQFRSNIIDELKYWKYINEKVKQ